MNEIIVNEAKAGVGAVIKGFFVAHKLIMVAIGSAAAGSATTIVGQKAIKAVKKRKLSASIVPIEDTEDEAAAASDDKVKPINTKNPKKNNVTE